MDRIGDHFLADAAFTLHQHRHARPRRLGGDGERGAEIGRGADDLVERQQRRNLFGQRAQFPRRRARHGRLQRGEQAFGRQRLHQEIGRASAHCRDGMRDRSVGGQHQDRQSRASFAQLGDQRAGIGIGRPMVEQDRVQLHSVLRAELRQRHLAIGGEDRSPAGARGQRRHQSPLRRFVVDQQKQPLPVARHKVFRPGSGQAIHRRSKGGLKPVQAYLALTPMALCGQ